MVDDSHIEPLSVLCPFASRLLRIFESREHSMYYKNVDPSKYKTKNDRSWITVSWSSSPYVSFPLRSHFWMLDRFGKQGRSRWLAWSKDDSWNEQRRLGNTARERAEPAIHRLQCWCEEEEDTTEGAQRRSRRIHLGSTHLCARVSESARFLSLSV